MKFAAHLLLAAFAGATAFAADDQAAWTAKVPPGLRKSPAFAYVKEDPALPRVLLIGDSISIGYTPNVREALKGKANVLRVPANASSSDVGLQKLDEWLGQGPWKVIHFNWGLHDLKHFKDGKLDLAGTQVSSLEQYEKNLRAIVARLKQTKANLIWATTTPVPDGSAGRAAGEEKKYNAVAAKVMKDEGVATNDLAALVAPKLGEYQKPQNVHFLPAGDQAMGEQTAAAIEKAFTSN